MRDRYSVLLAVLIMMIPVGIATGSDDSGSAENVIAEVEEDYSPLKMERVEGAEMGIIEDIPDENKCRLVHVDCEAAEGLVGDIVQSVRTGMPDRVEIPAEKDDALLIERTEMIGGLRALPAVTFSDETRASDEEREVNDFDFPNGSKIVKPADVVSGDLSYVSGGESDLTDWFKLQTDDVDPRANALDGLYNISFQLDHFRDENGEYNLLYEYEGSVDDYVDVLDITVIYIDHITQITHMGGRSFLYDDQDDGDGWDWDDNWEWNFFTPIVSDGPEDPNGWEGGLTEWGWYYIGLSLNFYRNASVPERGDFGVKYRFTLNSENRTDTDSASNDRMNGTAALPEGEKRIDSLYNQMDWYRIEGDDPDKLWNITLVVNRTLGTAFTPTPTMVWDNFVHVFVIRKSPGDDKIWGTEDDYWGFHDYATLTFFTIGTGYYNDRSFIDFQVKNNWTETDDREVYIGVYQEPKTWAVDPESGDIIGYYLPTWHAYSNYRIDVTLIEETPNTSPEITYLTVTSDYEGYDSGGNYDSSFTFEVEYQDADNDPPSELTLVLDPASVFHREYDLLGGEVDPDDTDHTDGKTYRLVLTGDELGDDPAVHDVQVNAKDLIPEGSIRISLDSEDLLSEGAVTVWDDYPVEYFDGWEGIPQMSEDDPTLLVSLERSNGLGMFNDPERSFSGFEVKDGEWGSIYDSDIMVVEVKEGVDGYWYAEITPKPDRHGSETISFMAYDEHSSASHDASVEIVSVDDPPMVVSVDVQGKTLEVDNTNPLRPELDFGARVLVIEDEVLEYTITAQDMDHEDDRVSLAYSFITEQSDDWYNPVIVDPGRGKVTLSPTNSDVARRYSRITVQVTDGTTPVFLTVGLNVLNMNDPPTLEVPFGTAEYTQYDKVEIDLKANDIDPGDVLEYFMNFEEAVGEDYLSVSDQLPGADLEREYDWDFRPTSGEFFFNVNDQDIWMTAEGAVDEVTIHLVFGVRDSFGSTDTAVVDVVLSDLNEEPPAVRFVYCEKVGEPSVDGTTVRLWVDPVEDPDLDEVAYKWDFGDGQKGEGPNVTHTYNTPEEREYTFTVFAWTADDEFDTTPREKTVQFTVVSPPPPPPPDDGDDNTAYLIAGIVILLIVVVGVLGFIILRKRGREEEDTGAGDMGDLRGSAALPSDQRVRPSLRGVGKEELPPARDAGMIRCPDCGESVDKEWLICPGCKRPLN